MFWTDDKIMTYPNMSVLEDVLTRNGDPDEWSFSPYRGQCSLLEEQFKNSPYSLLVTVKNIVNSCPDFSPQKAKANDDGANREYGASDAEQYYTRLEDIDEEFIVKYALNAIIGYKINNSGVKQVAKQMETISKWYDSEDDDYTSPTDYVETEEDFTVEEVLEAKQKLPYVLKQLWEGSLKYKGSLLSFVIAAEKYYRVSKSGMVVRPRDIVGYGVYRIDANGNPVSRFVIEDNTGNIFRTLYSWVTGEFPNDIYYKAYHELIRVCQILDIDITKEDARWYTKDVIKNALCTYLASNEEYLETYGFVNKEIIKMLKPDALFKVAGRLAQDEDAFSTVSAENVLDEIKMVVNKLRWKRPKEWSEKPELVEAFLKHYNVNVEECQTDIRRYDVSRGILENLDTTTLCVNVSGVLPTKWAVVSVSGHLIALEPFSLSIRVADISAYLNAIERGEGIGWSTINF